MTDEPMWTLVMFDAPVLSKQERRAANRFRNVLKDLGFSMMQYSVYSKYTPSGGTSIPVLKSIKANLPPTAAVRILSVRDKQWNSMIRFSGLKEETDDETPEQLLIF